MIIPFSVLAKKYGIKGGKILHIGAHKCEEREAYKEEGYGDDRVIWVEGNSDSVNEIKSKHSSVNILEAVIADKDGKEMEFIITNNLESSSILELDEHKNEHPHVVEVTRRKIVTKTVDTLLKENNINPSNIEFVNIDIQGAELLACKGAKSILYYANYLYLEVNEKSLYKDGALINELDSYLLSYGFRRKETSMTPHGWGDALYKKDDYSIYVNNCDKNTNGETYIWNRLRKEVKTLFDIGCRTDLDYCDPAITNYLFDPNPKAIEEIKIFESNRILMFNFGFGEYEEDRRLYLNSESVHFRNITNDKIENSVKCKLRKLDNFVKENNIETIDFVKIDTEGNEYFVLKGGKETLPKIKYIQFEYGGTYTDCGKKLSDVYSILKEGGFKYFYILTPQGLLGQPNPIEHLQYSNYLASKNPL